MIELDNGDPTNGVDVSADTDNDGLTDGEEIEKEQIEIIQIVMVMVLVMKNLMQEQTH